MDEEFRKMLSECLKEISIDLNDRQAEQFETFYRDLIEANKNINLTSITEKKDVVIKHFLDSLEIIRAVPDLPEKPYKIIDVGTGAGFPGIPMAILWPNLQLFLLDSLDKRISFIREEAEKLHLDNLQAEHERAEDFAGKPEYREHFDLCVSRAVANLSTLSEYCLPFIHIHGWFIPYKTETADEEIKKAAYAFSQLGGSVRNTIHFSLPENGGNRSLVMIEKIKVTPHKYPRKAGTPSRKPL